MKKPYVIKEKIFDDDVSEKLYGFFANENIKFKCADKDNAPYAVGNAVLASNGRLTSITIPVCKTLGVDQNGELVFTILVYGMSLEALKCECKRSYEIKVKAKEYGLSENGSEARKLITIDLEPYKIAVGVDESIGFFSPTDTICPALIEGLNDSSNDALNFIREKAHTTTGLYLKSGGVDLDYSHDTSIVNLEFERQYESEQDYIDLKKKTEYRTMVSELAKKYSGKYMSVLGDSISTYVGISDDATVNSTIGENAAYYPTWSPNVCSSNLTYWGKVADDLGMKICTVNSWSGSSAYGRGFGKNMLIRCADLHRDDGISPDVILIYMSANDINGGSPLDQDLAKIIADGACKKEIDVWFDNVKRVASESGGNEKGIAFFSYDAVYAISMGEIKRKYPKAELYCLTLQETNHPNTKKNLARFDKFNEVIRTLADYFGAGIVDFDKDEITWQNCHAYAGDMHSLHPTAAGHEIMAKGVVKSMYKNTND